MIQMYNLYYFNSRYIAGIFVQLKRKLNEKYICNKRRTGFWALRWPV